MKVLVSGAAGFVSSALLGYWANSKHDVGVEGIGAITSSSDQLRWVSKNKLVDIIESNVFFQKEYRPKINYDIYVHGMSAPRSFGNERSKANVTCLDRSLNRCRALGIKKFVYLSSGAVYRNSCVPVSEDDDLHTFNSTSDNYIVSKLIGESLVRSFCESNNMDYVILRLFTFSGPFLVARTEFVISDLIRMAVLEKKIYLKNPGYVRSYLHQSDMAMQIDRALAIDDEEIKTFNIGSAKEVGLLSLAEYISEACDAELFLPRKNIDHDSGMKYYVPDMSKLYRSMSDKPEKSLAFSIKDMVRTVRQTNYE